MPIRNEAAYIRRSLGSVLGQDYPAERLEILVVDGMSDDGTREIVAELANEAGSMTNRRGQTTHPAPHNRLPPVRLLDNPQRIVATALNIGLDHAKGQVIVRVDGHTEIAPDYVRRCVEALQRTGADNVGGRMDPIGAGPFGRAVAVATSTPFGVGGGRFHYSNREEWVDTVYLGAWPRAVFQHIGAFDTELVRNQDDEFNYRLRKHGGKILLSPAIRSRYVSRNSPGQLWRQYFQYGYWKVRVLQKHPRQMQPRQFAPPLFVLTLLLGGVLAPFSRSVRRLWTLLLALYAGATLVASGITAARRGWRHLPLLPLVFGILHISYGTGFCLGLVAFARRWFRQDERES